jgi:hypothetical protein
VAIETVRKRIAALSPLPSLTFEVQAAKLAKQIMRETRLPDRAETDAEHVAIAATAGLAIWLHGTASTSPTADHSEGRPPANGDFAVRDLHLNHRKARGVRAILRNRPIMCRLA